MIFLTITCVRFISFHLTTYYVLITMLFFQKQAQDFKIALTNYNSTATNGDLQ